jgi:hypothetical protein
VGGLKEEAEAWPVVLYKVLFDPGALLCSYPHRREGNVVSEFVFNCMVEIRWCCTLVKSETPDLDRMIKIRLNL